MDQFHTPRENPDQGESTPSDLSLPVRPSRIGKCNFDQPDSVTAAFILAEEFPDSTQLLPRELSKQAIDTVNSVFSSLAPSIAREILAAVETPSGDVRCLVALERQGRYVMSALVSPHGDVAPPKGYEEGVDSFCGCILRVDQRISARPSVELVFGPTLAAKEVGKLLHGDLSGIIGMVLEQPLKLSGLSLVDVTSLSVLTSSRTSVMFIANCSNGTQVVVSWGQKRPGVSGLNFVFTFPPDNEDTPEQCIQSMDDELGLTVAERVDLSLVNPSSSWRQLSSAECEALEEESASGLLDCLREYSPGLLEPDDLRLIVYNGWREAHSDTLRLLVGLIDEEGQTCYPASCRTADPMNPDGGLLLTITKGDADTPAQVEVARCFAPQVWGKHLALLQTEDRDASVWSELCQGSRDLDDTAFCQKEIESIKSRCVTSEDGKDRIINILFRYPEGSLLFAFHLSHHGTTLELASGMSMIELPGEPKRVEVTKKP